LPFLEMTWQTGTLKNYLDRLTAWERDSDVKASVNIAAASFKVSTENPQKRKCPKREGRCYYCGQPGHWSRECRKSRKNFREVNLFGQLFLSLLATLKQSSPRQ